MKHLGIVLVVLFSTAFFTGGGSVFAVQPADQPQEAAQLSGKVVETMDSGRYTYVFLEKNNKKTWVAVYKMKIVVGQEVAFKPGIEMRNFESKTLNRTFDRIIFSTGIVEQEGMKNGLKPE